MMVFVLKVTAVRDAHTSLLLAVAAVESDDGRPDEPIRRSTVESLLVS